MTLHLIRPSILTIFLFIGEVRVRITDFWQQNCSVFAKCARPHCSRNQCSFGRTLAWLESSRAFINAYFFFVFSFVATRGRRILGSAQRFYQFSLFLLEFSCTFSFTYRGTKCPRPRFGPLTKIQLKPHRNSPLCPKRTFFVLGFLSWSFLIAARDSAAIRKTMASFPR